MKLSYIIPAYNASGTIVSTLNSLYSTSLPEDEYEVIVVDDCSNDNTCVLVEQYSHNHRNLSLIRQSQNHRQGAARNRGLEVAKGEYITFVDADDHVLEGVVDALGIAERNKTDLVYCSCYHERSLTSVAQIEIDMSEKETLSGVDFCEKYYYNGVFFFPWGILYRCEWLRALNYPFVEDRQHEDRDWLAYVMIHAGSVAYSKQPMYRYVFNINSTCHHPRYSTVFDHVASGIRHIDLSRRVKENCPKSSALLFNLGKDEILRAISLRNLTQFKWEENKNLYDDKHIVPLLPDLKRICETYHMPFNIRMFLSYPILTKTAIFIARPIALFIRRIK